jgi:hypothetical protein
MAGGNRVSLQIENEVKDEYSTSNIEYQIRILHFLVPTVPV